MRSNTPVQLAIRGFRAKLSIVSAGEAQPDVVSLSAKVR